MKVNIKAFLLSTFVLPGLGQLYKGDRLKGVILIVLVNIFLLIALFMILRSLGPVIVSAQIYGMVDVGKILEQLQAKSPAARWLLASFFALWLYSAVDAVLQRKIEAGSRDR